MIWDNIIGHLRPYTLRLIREDLRDAENPPKAEINEITEMLVDLDGDQDNIIITNNKGIGVGDT